MKLADRKLQGKSTFEAIVKYRQTETRIRAKNEREEFQETANRYDSLLTN